MLKFLLDFFPLLAFFVSFKIAGIYVAVTVLMIATAVQTIGGRLLQGKWQKLHLIGLAIALVFGGLTLALHDERFIKWKVTFFFWFLAVFFAAGAIRRRSPIKALIESANEEQLTIPSSVWFQIDVTWAIASVLIGCTNLYVAFNYSLDTWVNFKVIGISILQVLLFIYTFFVLYQHLPAKETSENSAGKE